MSFADDIRNNYVEKEYYKEKKDPNPRVVMTAIAEEIIKEKKMELMQIAKSSSGYTSKAYTGIGKLIKRPCVSTSIYFHGHGFRDNRIAVLKDEDGNNVYYYYEEKDLKKFYNILKNLCSAEGISTELDYRDRLGGYNIYFRVFL